MEHTPWKTEPCKRHQGCTDVVTSDGVFVVCVRGDRPEIADSIVCEHNAHDDLLAACKEAVNMLDTLVEDFGDEILETAVYKSLTAAIAKANTPTVQKGQSTTIDHNNKVIVEQVRRLKQSNIILRSIAKNHPEILVAGSVRHDQIKKNEDAIALRPTLAEADKGSD